MTEYKKKKKLIEDNGDIYISDYDKNLSYEALEKIVNAKKEYAEGAKNNDKALMTAANNKANAVRAQYGSYTAGEYGNEYHPTNTAQYSFDKYNSKYDYELDRLYDALKNNPSEFVYDYKTDPVYLAYESLYDTKGNLAYERALAKNSLKTGGIENTNAQSAAMQAMNYYNTQLASVIPELYNAAYERYYNSEIDKYNRLFDNYKTISEREKRDYDRYLDNQSLKQDERDYLFDLYENEKNRIYKRTAELDKYDFESDILEKNQKFESEEKEKDRALQQASELDKYKFEYAIQDKKQQFEKAEKDREFVYNLIRDIMEDEKWKNEYNLDSHKSLYPAYSGNIGTGDILSYARQLFANPALTMEDLYNLLGI